MGINIAKLVAKNLKKYGKPLGVKKCTLLRPAQGVRIPTAVSGGTNTTMTSYACSGFISMLTNDEVPGTLVQANDRKISILGATLNGIIPSPNDYVTIVDLDGISKTFALISAVGGDGVGAIYSFQARK